MSTYTPLSAVLPEGIWPDALAGSGGVTLLDRLSCLAFDERADDAGYRVFVRARVLSEVRIPLPLLEGTELVLGEGDSEETGLVDVDLAFAGRPDGPPVFELRIVTTTLSLSLRRDLFTPVDVTEEGGRLRVTPRPGNVAIPLPFALLVRFDGSDWSLDFDVPAGDTTALNLPLCAVGGSGVVIEAAGLQLNLSGTGTRPAGAAPGWKGLYLGSVTLYLPQLFNGNIAATGLGIGTGGLYGELDANFALAYDAAATPRFTGGLATPLFGMEGGIRNVELRFVQSVPTAFSVTGRLLLPFFEAPVDVSIGIDAGGRFAVALDSPSGLLTLEKPGVLRLRLESLGFAVEEGVFTARLSGQVTPLVGTAQGLQWPSFRVTELSIDSQGRVKLEGGWLDLREQYSLNLYGFRIEIARMGFGSTDDGGKWIGFSGGLRLVEGLSAGASVEGLRLTWYEDGVRAPRITLNGVGVEFEVPGVLRFQGSVSYRELPGNVHRFDGDIRLNLVSLGVQVDAALVIGTAPAAGGGTYAFMAIHLAAELPAGIPLWSTGLALYGMQGLFALQMEPDKRADEEWYAIGGAGSWYHRGTPGVTDLRNKWTNREGSLALGAGVTLGTVADNGFTFSGRMLLVLVFPGPILMVEGRANLLKARARLSDEPVFRALAVLDNRAGTFLVGLDAQYRYGGGGELIDIRGGAEAFFSLSDGNAWHLYLGEREPRANRIRANILRLFEANAYFMLDASRLAVGAWIGYEAHWRFGPLKVDLEAWIEANAIVSWNPAHFYGDLWLHGHVGLSVFGIGISATVDARIRADVFDPFHVVGEFGVAVNLPWPLPDVEAQVTVEWGPEPVPPPLPLPLREVAVEHFKVTTSWPLARGTLLLPDLDGGGGFLPAALVSTPLDAAPPAGLPVVPLDARPHLTFTRPVHDDAAVGVNPQPVTPPWERLGNPEDNVGPARVRYTLASVALHRWDGGTATWTAVAAAPAAGGAAPLFGSWAPVPALPSGQVAPGSDPPVGQVKLWLWSRTPFDYTRHTGRAWDEWFTDAFGGYPCVPPAPDRRVCCRFAHLPPGEARLPLGCGEKPGLALWGDHTVTVQRLDPPVEGETRAVVMEPGARTVLRLSEPAREVELWVVGEEAERGCVDFRGRERDQGPNPRTEGGVVFQVFDVQGAPRAGTRIAGEPDSGLDAGYRTDATLPCAAAEVECTVVHRSRAVTVTALAAGGRVVAETVTTAPAGVPETVRLRGEGIATVVVRAPGGETHILALCHSCALPVDLRAEGYDAEGKAYGPFGVEDGRVTVRGVEMQEVGVWAKRPARLVRMCATFGPDPAEVRLREEMASHLRDALARWSDTGEVLAPHTTYRLAVSTRVEAVGEAELAGWTRTEELTELAYFRTEGPPGVARLSVPAGHPTPDTFASGLDDLARYVRQTVPATVPPPGVKSILPRPVYRAYDVGAEFNEDYVDLLYRISGRDLGLYLYDNNGLPVRDAAGRLVARSNRWGRTETLTLTESEERWVSVVNGSTCARIGLGEVPRSRTLAAADAAQVLDADTLYEARLVPLLLAEDFAAYAPGTSASGTGSRLGGWRVEDQGTDGAPSRWEVQAIGTEGDRGVVQRSGIGSSAAAGAYQLGTLLLRGDEPGLAPADAAQPGEWTDYRVSVYLRAAAAGSLGVVVRHQGPGHYYRYACDHGRGFRRLEKVVGGVPSVLAQDAVRIDRDRDYLVSVEVAGPSIRVFQDGEAVFAATDGALARGRPGLYAWRHTGARFNDVRVDDLRAAAPVVYRFAFTTSRYTDFFHHLHSFQDEVWPGALPDDADVAALLDPAASPASPVSTEEARGYDAFALRVLGAEARRDPERVEVAPVRHRGRLAALLLRSPEPLDWGRTELQVTRAAGRTGDASLPRDVKLTDVTFGAAQPGEESVTLLLRQAMSPAGYRVEYRGFAGAPGDDPALAAAGAESLLSFPRFEDGAEAGFEVVDEGAWNDPSRWEAAGGVLRQTRNTYGGRAADPDKPGTFAVTGDAAWRDYRVRVRLSSHDNDAIGVLFRYRDPRNYYRFSMDRERGYRRLVRKLNGVVTVLWEDGERYTKGREYVLTLEAAGSRLSGWLDGVRLFAVGDEGVQAGRVGLYCWANVDARFAALRVESPAWVPYFTFGAEERLPAGTRVRVLAGPAGAPAAEPGVTTRYVDAAAGRLRLLPQGTDLRVVSPAGTEEHRREFLPPGRYTPVAVRVLRKADGTGVAVVPAARGESLPEGRYRLRFVYRRDNRARDAASQVLSQAGATSPETATLDVPSPDA